MLKQPLLSRLFKLPGAGSIDQPVQTDITPSDTAIPSQLLASQLLLDSDLAAAQTEKKPIRPTRKRRIQLSAKPALALSGLFIAFPSLAFVQFAPASAKASVENKLPMLSPVLSEPIRPISANGDPTAGSLIATSELYLTHQVLYRKLEAIAGVTLNSPPPQPILPTSLTASTPNAAAASDAKQGSKPAESSQAEQVKANAPPAPAIAPTSFSGTTIDSVLEMRVAVAKDVPAVGLATSGKGVITDLDGNTLKSLSAEQGVTAKISSGIVIDGENMPSAFWVYSEDGGYVAVGDSWYRGRVLVALRERGLIAVNYVLLGDYLYSVVGSEMSPGWAIESLKAQAVAARSYALTHNIRPASEAYFDLDNTQRFQAYKGIGREADTTQAAVQATAGEFISHEGGIVESLYAASQAIVDDAHKGSGMSQLGAKDLAEQGYSYQEILAHYYPGTALGRLETDQQ